MRAAFLALSTALAVSDNAAQRHIVIDNAIATQENVFGTGITLPGHLDVGRTVPVLTTAV
jgi:hypothetical protein